MFLCFWLNAAYRKIQIQSKLMSYPTLAALCDIIPQFQWYILRKHTVYVGDAMWTSVPILRKNISMNEKKEVLEMSCRPLPQLYSGKPSQCEMSKNIDAASDQWETQWGWVFTRRSAIKTNAKCLKNSLNMWSSTWINYIWPYIIVWSNVLIFLDDRVQHTILSDLTCSVWVTCLHGFWLYMSNIVANIWCDNTPCSCINTDHR